MTDDLTLWPETPEFIKLFPEMQGHTGNPCELFDFWSPERTGDDALDFQRGQQHCHHAIAFARSIGGGGNVVSNIVGGMYRHGAGPMERGFLETLSSRATYGNLPPLIDSEALEATTQLSGLREAELRYGEQEAREYLLIARDVQFSGLIHGLMVGAVNLEMGYGASTFIWTVCGAAVIGSLN